MSILSQRFFDRHHLTVAQALIGCQLRWDGVGGVVVETEAYAAVDDPACHTAHRPSARAFFESHPPGTAYVYLNYGVHWLLNVLASDGIVLIRAIEPTLGLRRMMNRRGRSERTTLCSGPGKLGQSLALTGADHGACLTTRSRGFQSRPTQFEDTCLVTDVRIGISAATDRPWRFLLSGNPHVSKPPSMRHRPSLPAACE